MLFRSDDFIGEAMRGPLLLCDGDIMPPAPFHLVLAGVFQAAHHRHFVAFLPRPHPGNELGGAVHSQVDVGPERGAAVGEQINVSFCGVHLEAAGGFPPCGSVPEGGLAVALVMGQAIPGDDFSG